MIVLWLIGPYSLIYLFIHLDPEIKIKLGGEILGIKLLEVLILYIAIFVPNTCLLYTSDAADD